MNNKEREKMEIKIAHLFPEELNLYGENGNIKALKYYLLKENITPKITNINLDDELNMQDYDFIYIGSGRKKNLDLVKEVLKTKKEEILNYLKQDKIFLVTGNAISLFDFLDLYEIDEYDYKVGNVIARTSLCNGLIKAFQNTEYLIKTPSNIIFSLDKGYGNSCTMLEGYQNHNFYATSLIGPILARNKELTQYFINILKTNLNLDN